MDAILKGLLDTMVNAIALALEAFAVLVAMILVIIICILPFAGLAGILYLIVTFIGGLIF